MWVVWFQNGSESSNINNMSGPRTAKEHTVQWWFKKLCKGDEGLEHEEHSGQPQEVDNNQLRAIIKADPLTTAQEAAEEPNVDRSMVVWLLKQIGMVKKLNKWVPQAGWRSKTSSFECCLLLFYAIMNHFSIGFWRAMKSGFYMTTIDYQLSV